MLGTFKLHLARKLQLAKQAGTYDWVTVQQKQEFEGIDDSGFKIAHLLRP